MMLPAVRAAQAVDVIVNDFGDAFHGPPSGCAVTGTGTCTLRDAIHYSNVTPGTDVIRFAFSGTVAVGPGGLPTISDTMSLTGYAWGGGQATINGSAAGGADGLTVAADGCGIGAIRITGFGGAGIRITGDGNSVGNGFCHIVCPPGTRIFDNGGHGVVIEGSNNRLGYTTIDLNGGDGVRLRAGASGNEIGYFYGNLIKNNAGAGVRVGESAADVSIAGNRISYLTALGNGGLAIDLGDAGVTANDPQDGDSGPNGLQNFPVLTSAVNTNGAVVVSGTLDSTPNTTFEIFVYAAAALDPSGHGEADDLLTQFSVTTDALGSATFTESMGESVPAGWFVTAMTKTESSFSELGAGIPVTELPALSFYTVTPCRVLDTRDPDGPWGGPAVGSRIFRIAGRCGIPEDAVAVSFNVTAFGGSGGSVIVTPAHSSMGYYSSVHFRDYHVVRANNEVMGLILGDLKIWATNPAHVMLDVNGYFR